ncbi:MAG TPA: arginase [Actinomycetota bacterium]|nr:arginase [Actinomycetota bacterium]
MRRSGPSTAATVGAPLDLGASRRGVDMGPSAIRYAGLEERLEALGIDVVDCGNVVAELPETAPERDEHARYLAPILASCAQIAGHVARVSGEGRLPLVLGGDHSIAMGTLAGLVSVHGPGGVLWVDAHGDLNRPETSPSGNVHGMPLAAALGRCGFEVPGYDEPPWVDRGRLALVGVRALDPGEKSLVEDLGLCALTMSDIDRRGIASVMHEALTVVQGSGFVHVSLDVDVLDPEVAPGVGTPVPGGLSYREAHLAMELVAESGMLSSLEVVEVNPMFDTASSTAEVAVDLIASAMGATIL